MEAGHFTAETQGAFAEHDEITKEKKKKHLYPHQPEHMSVGATLQEGEDRTGGYGQQQTNVHIFGFNRSTGGDSIDHRCTCLGNNWA